MACDPCERGSVLAIGVGQIGAHPSLSQFPLPKSCWIVPCTGAHGETEPGSNLLGVHHRGAKIAVQPSVTLGGHYAPTFTVAFVLDPDWRRRKFKDYRAHRPRPVMEGGKKCSIEKGTLPALSRTAIFRILRSSFSPPLEFCGRIPVQGILSARRTATGRNLMRLGPRRRTPAIHESDKRPRRRVIAQHALPLPPVAPADAHPNGWKFALASLRPCGASQEGVICIGFVNITSYFRFVLLSTLLRRD